MTNLAQRLVMLAAILVVATMALWVIAHRTPGQHYAYPVCPFYSLTHLYCPGCGSGRAIGWLLRMDVLNAARCNLLLVLCLPVILYAFMSEALLAIRSRGLAPIVLNRTTGTAVVAIVLGFWLLRNIPVYPFTLLAP